MVSLFMSSSLRYHYLHSFPTRRSSDLENTEGLYVMMGGHFKKDTPDEVATEIDLNTRKGVERIIRHAFEFARSTGRTRSEEHTSELQSPCNLVCRLLLEKKKKQNKTNS